MGHLHRLDGPESAALNPASEPPQPTDQPPATLPLRLLWLAGLAALFFGSYSFTNWLTALRAPVPSVQFAWEQHIPFLAWTILPYWATDLLYAWSVLFCRTRAELFRHGKRLIFVQLFATLCFLLFPLQCLSVRPPVEGVEKLLLDLLLVFDRPYNQAPSLHVAITVVLWNRFAQHFRGALWWLLRALLIISALSTLTTFQHHFVDLPSGLWLGLLALAVYPEQPQKDFAPQHGRGRWVFALFYSALAFGLFSLALRWGGFALWLLWGAASLLLVALMYSVGRPFLLRKQNGRFPFELRLLFGPYFWLARANAWFWTRNLPMTQEIAPGVWLGRAPRSAEELRAHGFQSVVDFTSEIVLPLQGEAYWAVPMLDMIPPNVPQLEAGVAAIEASAGHRPTLVCCALGFSRSASSIAAWLLHTGQAPDMPSAVARITAIRPQVVLTRLHRAKLQEFAAKVDAKLAAKLDSE